MIGRAVAWFAGRWATAAASNYLAVGLAVAIGIGGIYIQQLRVRAAECKTAQDVMERYERLADRLEKQRNIERDDAISEIENAVNDCLDSDVDDLLRGDPVEGG